MDTLGGNEQPGGYRHEHDGKYLSAFLRIYNSLVFINFFMDIS